MDLDLSRRSPWRAQGSQRDTMCPLGPQGMLLERIQGPDLNPIHALRPGGMYSALHLGRLGPWPLSACKASPLPWRKHNVSLWNHYRTKYADGMGLGGSLSIFRGPQGPGTRVGEGSENQTKRNGWKGWKAWRLSAPGLIYPETECAKWSCMDALLAGRAKARLAGTWLAAHSL